MINLEEMSAKELTNLKINIEMEINKRQKLEYNEALKNFYDAFYELYSKFPNMLCFTDENTTWEELYEDNCWDF